MRYRVVLLFLLAFVFALPSVGRDAGVYFSISTSKTFLPGERVGIRVYATGVNALEFRVYKIRDPIAFFERLQSPHDFGHVVPREQIEEKSFLERFQDWKHEIWASIRDYFRAQYSARSRAAIRESEGAARKSTIGSAAVFAQAPVLNSSQLVARWRQSMLRPLFVSETQVVPVSDLPKGVYLVEATDGTLRAYTIVIVSDLGLVTKSAPGQLLAFAADRRTGAPAPSADVRVWSDKKEDARIKADQNGLARTSMPTGRYEDIRVVAVHGDDVALVTPYSYNLSSNADQDWAGYVYTDRPVYRPTHTVHFKVILRKRNGEAYQVPSGESVQVLIEDPDAKPVLQSNFKVSPFGTVNGDLDLPVTAALGYYSITVRSSSGSAYPVSGGFHVEEYKKPEYEVKVNPVSQMVLQGNAIEATIEARYYFGEPVAGAQVKYVVNTSPYYSPFVDRDDEDGDSAAQEEQEEPDGDGSYDYAGQQISEQSARLDADGRLKIQIPTPLDAHHRDMRYRIEARVTDDANREIAGHNSVIATYGSFQVGVSAESYVFQKGESIRATAFAKDYDGRPIVTPIHVELLKNASPWAGQSGTLIQSVDTQTEADGSVPLTFMATEAGNFTLRATARTPENRDVTGDAWVWVSSPNEDWWSGENREIRMVPDKKSYKVGETAHVLVLTGVPEAYLLVTTEAITLQSSKVIHAAAPSVMVDIPVQSEQQPNVFVSVAFLHDNELYHSSKNLKVPAVEQQLRVDIQPSQKQFEPGQKGSYLVEVHDASGKPAAGEFSLSVVDEAIYAIHPDESGDILDAFYGSAYNRVSTDSSLEFYFSGEAGKREMFLAYRKATSSRALAQLKPETLVQPRVRKVFPDTALWLADLRTDANGRAQAELTFPDSLTSWRATVRGVTVDTKVGSTINNVIVRKNLIVRLATPRFFRQGDEVTVSAIVHNYLPTAKSVQLSLEVQGLDVLSGSTGKIEVASKAEQKLDWRVRADSARQAVLTAKALSDQESDAMELTLPILPIGVKRSDAQSGAIVDDDEAAKTVLMLPGDPAQASPAIDLSLSSSYAGSIFAALDYLTSYPYGCTEQTMSSFLPDIVVAKAMKDLQVHTNVDTPELQEKIKAGMARLKDFQHDDGGWGWWKDDESQVFMTAYVVSGFGQSHAAGYDFDAMSLEKAVNWLHGMLDQHPNMRADLRAYVVYALALNGAVKKEELQKAWDERDSMSAQGLAMLGLAMQTTGDLANAREIAAKVESLATVDDREAFWPSSYDYLMEFDIDDGAETTGYAVRLLSLVKPASPLLPKAAFWLVANRNGGYFWDSTKQTAMVIFGLTEYLKASHELNADFQAEVYINGKQVMTRHFTSADALNPVQPSIHLDSSQLQSGPNEIEVRKKGVGRLYWSATGTYYSAEKRLVQNNKLSLNITRDYFRLTPQQKSGKIVYQLDPLAGELHVGDIVAVRITVGGSEWRYLLMEDPIPAGAEFIQRDDLYDLKQRPSWWQDWFSRREFHDDRAAIFQTYFNGQQQYVYLLKIVNPGTFHVNPAMVQPMYQPSIQATTDSATVEVK